MFGRMAQRDYGEYNEDYIHALRDYYIHNPITVNELARMTGGEEFPLAISVGKLKFYAMQGRWRVLKHRTMHGKSGLPDSIQDEIDDLRQEIFDTIVDPDDEMSARDKASMVQAYMNLQAAGKSKGSSARTPIGDLTAMLEEHDAKRASGTNDKGS